MIIGSAIGLALGQMKRGLVLRPRLILFLNIPALVTIILCYIWFGLNELAAILAVASTRSRMSRLLCAKARAPWIAITWISPAPTGSDPRTLRHVVLPQLAPFFSGDRALRARVEVWKMSWSSSFWGVATASATAPSSSSSYLMFQAFSPTPLPS